MTPLKKLVAECMLLVAIFFTVATLAMGQCPPLWEISNDCGDIQANGGLGPNQPIIFCEGMDIVVANNSTPANQITKTYIDWGDGTACQTFPNCPASFSHAYDFPNDTCIGGAGLLTFNVRLGVEKTCSNFTSFHYNTFPIAVRFKPVAELAVSPQTACVNTPVDFINNSCPNANNPVWLWTINGQMYTTEEVLDYQFPSAGTYNVSLAVTNSCGTDISSAAVSATPPATAVAMFTPTSPICAGTTVTFTNQSTNALGYAWMVMPSNGWMFVNGTNQNSVNPAIKFNSPGTYTIKLKVSGCGSPEWTATIEVLAPPSISIAAIPDECATGVVSINPTATSGGTNVTVQWSFPGGTPATFTGATPPAITYSGTGPQIVTATATVNGCPGMPMDIDTFNIAAAATAIFSLSDNDICGPDEIVTVMDNSINATSNYHWSVLPNADFMYVNGTSATNAQPQFKFSAEGDFTITLNVSACGNPTASALVHVRLKPSISLTVSTDPCQQSVTLSPGTLATFGGGISDVVTWTFLNGSIPSFSGLNPPPVTFSGVGDHAITVEASNACGMQTVSDTFPILAPATAAAAIADDSLCAPGELLVVGSNTSTFATGYQWSVVPAAGSSFVNGTSSTSPMPQLQFTQEGLFTLTLSVNGCGSPTWDTLIHVLLTPIVAVTEVIEGCVDFMANPLDYGNISGGQAHSITWTFGGGSPATAFGATPGMVNFSGYGQHFILLEAQNACGLVSAVDSFQIYEPATIALTSAGPICNSVAPIQLQATPNNPNGWSGPGVTPGGLLYPDQVPKNLLNTLVPYVYEFGVATCLVKDTLYVQVNGTTVDVGPDMGFCANAAALTLPASPNGGFWSGDTVTVGGGFDPTTAGTGSHLLIYTYTDMATNCTNADTMVATVLGPPTAALDSIGNVCLGDEIDFGPLSGGTDVSSCFWEFGDGITANVCDPLHTYAQPGTYDLTLFVLNQAGCRDTAMVQLQIVTPPNAGFATDITEGCADLPVTITNQSSLNNYTLYIWDYGDGRRDTLPQPGIITFYQGEHDTTYTITLLAQNQCGEASDAHPVTVFPRPQVRFGSDLSSGCTPLEVNFNNVSVGEPDFFQWFVNGAAVGTQFQLPQQVFLTTDDDSTYFITLIAGNECGFDTVTHTVLVKPNPVVAFFNTDTLVGCQPFTIRLIDYSTQGLYLSWDFGDGNLASGDSVVHTFLQAGQYFVQEFVNNGCGFDTAEVTITVLPAPDVSFTHLPFVCAGGTIFFQNTSSNLAGSFWDFGDGQGDSTHTSPNHAFAQAGQYTVTLTGLAVTTGCQNDAVSTLEVKPLPLPAVALPDSFGCQPFLFQPQNLTSGTNFYIWDFGNMVTSTETAPAYTYTQPGVYTLGLQVTDLFGCRTNWAYTPLNVFPKPVAAYAYDQAELCVTPTFLQFQNQSVDADSYHWDFGPLGTSDQKNPALTVSNPLTLSITLFVESQYHCLDTVMGQAKIYTKPALDFAAAPASGCEPLPVLFENNSTSVNQYAWHFGDGIRDSVASPYHIYEHAGLYTVTLFASADSLCFDSLTFSALVEVLPSPTAAFSYAEVMDPVVNPNGTIAFQDSSLNALAWHWDFGDGDTSVQQNPAHRYYVNGPKVVTLIVYNGIGCSDTAVQTILPQDFGGLFIPNALSPESGEPGARVFLPVGEGLIEFEIAIYASNGERVWHSNHLNEGQPDESWDGTYREKLLDQGLYWWKANARFYNGRIWQGMRYGNDEPVTEGKVLLIR